MNYVLDQLEDLMVSVQNHDLYHFCRDSPDIPRGNPLSHLPYP